MKNDLKIAVIGLGYVGLPLARLFSTKYKTAKEIGIDLGITDFATLSDGTKIKAPKPLKRKLKKLKKLKLR